MNAPQLGSGMSLVDFMLSERQQKVLQALILREDLAFSVSDLIRLAGPGNGATQRVLDKFEAAGIVKKRSRGNQRLYNINPDHPIYPELRSICVKTFGVAEVIAKGLEPFESRIETAFVFGSIARGDSQPDSDIDLMIVGNIDFFEVSAALERVQIDLGRAVHLKLHLPQEWQALKSDRIIRAINEDQKIVLFKR